MKVAVIGTGKIISEALYAMDRAEHVKIRAIYARPHSIKKAEDFSIQYNIPEVYTNYDELLETVDADTVYVALVNSVHYEYAKKALEAGYNVILEKPFTSFADEAEELVSIAERKGLMVLEAITVLHNDVFEQMKKNLPLLGTIRMFSANYSQYSSRYDNYLKGVVEPAFDPEAQAGSLGDLNVYNIHYAIALFGMPARVNYFPHLGWNGVDTSGVLVLGYPDFEAVCTAAKDSDSPCFLTIQGEKGYMKIDGKPNAAKSLKTEWVNPDASEKVPDESGAMVRATLKEDFEPEKKEHRMVREFEDFAKIIDHKDHKEAARLMRESVQTVKVMEMARESAGIPFKRK